MEKESWFALGVRPRAERIVSQLIRDKGFEEYLPIAKSVCRPSDGQVQKHRSPLFPGYLFCRMDLANRMPILTTPGVNSIVGAGKKAIAIKDEEIERVRQVVSSGLPVKSRPGVERGQAVRIETGPLRGVEGVVLRHKDDLRLVVSIQLLNRAVEVVLSPDWLAPIQSRYVVSG